jgi:hypothetical protein
VNTQTKAEVILPQRTQSESAKGTKLVAVLEFVYLLSSAGLYGLFDEKEFVTPDLKKLILYESGDS